jgi:DNA-binding NarL/FixJ family response regulator
LGAAGHSHRTGAGGAGPGSQGPPNAAIAARLLITEKAVDKHINNGFRKLDLVVSAEDNRRVLAALAYRDSK